MAQRRRFTGEFKAQMVQQRIAELERMVGRLTMQLEIAKKASALLNSQPSRSDR